MNPNTLSVHFSIRDNDEDHLMDQGTVVIPKVKGWKGKIDSFRHYIESFFRGGRNGRH